MITVKMPHNKQEKFQTLRDLKTWAKETRTRSPKTTNRDLSECLGELNTKRKQLHRPPFELKRKGDGWALYSRSGKELKYISKSRSMLHYLEGLKQGLSAGATGASATN